MNDTLYETNFNNINLFKRGKVRDVYDLDDYYLIVATDRLSAFDVILPDPIPEKGKVLTKISLFWFKNMESIVANHIVSSCVKEYPLICQPYADVLNNRSMLVKKTTPLPIECVVRGYISGSGWMAYKQSGEVCGIKLPKGLKESDRLPQPIFTPSTKEDIGYHDVNIDFSETEKLIGKPNAEKVRDISLSIYKKAADIADKFGIIIADTKFEFGIYDNEIILIDEVLTPDSSRFWLKKTYSPGGSQQSYDKQYVRDYLLTLKWNKRPPGPNLPNEIINMTSLKYLEALKLFNLENNK
jgi:phosphoribosylaminoimidazole-succinocarboxamide synthase